MIRALRALGATDPLRVRVAGSCMTPVLRDGDLVTVRPMRRYWPGDVVAFLAAEPEDATSGDAPLTMHRVIGWGPLRLARPISAWGLWTQADGASLPDRPVPKSRVLGRVELTDDDRLRRVRSWGRFVAHLGRRLGAALMLRASPPFAILESVKRTVTARRTTLTEPDPSFDREFWSKVGAERRVALVWDISVECFELSGRLPGESGRPRFIAHVLRP